MSHFHAVVWIDHHEAKVFGFKEYPLFQAPADAKQVPKVNFSKS